MTLRITALVQKFEGALTRDDALGRRLARGGWWAIVAVGTSRAFYLIAGVLVARTLGRDVFGQLGLLQTTLGMLGVFAGFGLGATATKYVAELREVDRERAGRLIVLSWSIAAASGLTLGTALFIAAPWFASSLLGASSLAGPLRVTAVLVLLTAVNGVQAGTLAGFEGFRGLAHMSLVSGLIAVPLMTLGAQTGGLTGALWGLIGSYSVAVGMAHRKIHQYCATFDVPLFAANPFRELRVLRQFSLPVLLSSLLVVPVMWAATVMLARTPSGFAELGLFNVGNQWRTALIFVPETLSSVTIAVVASTLSKDRMATLRVWKVLTLFNGGLLLVMALILAMASGLILRSYGPAFQPGTPTFLLMLLAALLVSVQIPTGSLILASGRAWIGFFMNAGWAVVLLVAAAFLVPFGAEGLAMAFVIAYVAHGSWTFAYARKRLFRAWVAA